MAPPLTRAIRIMAEQEPVVFFSSVLGITGLLLPILLGNSTFKKAEEESSSYAFRIKHVYPPK